MMENARAYRLNAMPTHLRCLHRSIPRLPALLALAMAASIDAAPKEVFIWREAEDVALNWGASSYRPTQHRNNANWYSGRGGASQKEPAAFTWRFEILREVAETTLQPLTRTYHAYVRLYGYRQRPPVEISFDGKKIADFRTRKTEVTDAQGKYVAPGTFYWEPAGTFTTTGGQHALTVDLKGSPIWLDAILLTTDPDFRPRQLEARAIANKTFFTDLRTHEIHAEFRHNGVSDRFASPVSLRLFPLGGRAFFVKLEQDVTCHLIVPDALKVLAVSSHFAGVTWKHPRAHKQVALRTLASTTLHGQAATHYAVDVSYVGLDLVLFMQARSEGFAADKVVKAQYWLESDKGKQPPADLAITLVDVPKAKPFKTIFIGPCGGQAAPHFADFPGVTKTMCHAGLNFCNPWWLDICYDRYREVVGPFLTACRDAGIIVVDEHSPFFGTFGPHPKRETEDLAVDIDGKRVHRPSLIVGEPVLARNLDRIRHIASIGLQGAILDDEDYNQKCDWLDYSDRVKQAFREYLAASTGLAYEDPIAIVRNKAEKAALYDAWVTFKCECVLNRYVHYRQAFEEGLRQASANHQRTFFIAQILKNKTPEESRTNTFWDYRLLARHCTHISPMIYTYGGICHAGIVGDVVRMYADYVGRDIIVPTLLAGHGGFGEVKPVNKPMIKYEIMESLMQKAPGILFWNAVGTFNALNLAQISEGIRQTQPYEDFFLRGEPCEALAATPNDTRVRALRLGNRLLVYVARYTGDPATRARVSLKEGRVITVLDVATDKATGVAGNGFATDFATDRGRLFMLTLAE